jgi:prepilin-type N-terminal cleavage/methylation domain-containing protein
MPDNMRRRSHRPGRQAGYSLIEALFVVIILGVIAGYAFPVVERSVAQSKADRAGQAISNELRNAFSLAARQRKPVRITFNATNRTMQIADRASGQVMVRRDFSNANSPFGLTSMTVSSSTIDVFPNGVASGTLQVNFAVATNSRVVNMTRIGHVRVQ